MNKTTSHTRSSEKFLMISILLHLDGNLTIVFVRQFNVGCNPVMRDDKEMPVRRGVHALASLTGRR